uniref:Uncharacterized protein n=1 Tax=Oryza rufipogon TaxID=4529 RepID=A0A0E0PPP0_ORYRU
MHAQFRFPDRANDRVWWKVSPVPFIDPNEKLCERKGKLSSNSVHVVRMLEYLTPSLAAQSLVTDEPPRRRMTAGARGQSPCPQKRRLTNQYAMSMLDVGDGVGRAQPVGDEDLARGHTEPGPEDIGVQREVCKEEAEIDEDSRDVIDLIGIGRIMNSV